MKWGAAAVLLSVLCLGCGGRSSVTDDSEPPQPTLLATEPAPVTVAVATSAADGIAAVDPAASAEILRALQHGAPEAVMLYFMTVAGDSASWAHTMETAADFRLDRRDYPDLQQLADGSVQFCGGDVCHTAAIDQQGVWLFDGVAWHDGTGLVTGPALPEPKQPKVACSSAGYVSMVNLGGPLLSKAESDAAQVTFSNWPGRSSLLVSGALGVDPTITMTLVDGSTQTVHLAVTC